MTIPPSTRTLNMGSRGRLASMIADAVQTVAGVRLTGGSGVEVATLYPGGKVLGVKLGPDELVVHVIAERLPLEPVVEAVRRAVVAAALGLGDRRPVTVIVDDLDIDILPLRWA